MEQSIYAKVGQNLTELSRDILKAICILKEMPVGTSFDRDTLDFFQKLYLWKRPDKFFLDDDQEIYIVAGNTAMYDHNTKALQFKFNNGYIWMASICKLTSRNTYRRLVKLAEQIVAKELPTRDLPTLPAPPMPVTELKRSEKIAYVLVPVRINYSINNATDEIKVSSLQMPERELCERVYNKGYSMLHDSEDEALFDLELVFHRGPGKEVA